MRETPSSADVQLFRISSRRISSVNHWCAAAPNKRGKLCSTLAPLSLGSAAEYRSAFNKAGSR
jgi:hypothetical protein